MEGTPLARRLFVGAVIILLGLVVLGAALVEQGHPIGWFILAVNTYNLGMAGKLAHFVWTGDPS